MVRAAEDDARWFVVRDRAPRPATEAAIRSALTALRDRIAYIELDLVSDDDWPEHVLDELRRAEARLPPGRNAVTVTLDPGVEADLDLALALAPFSICSSGFDTGRSLVWESNDTGASAAFALGPAEQSEVRAAVVDAGGVADDLTALVAHHLRGRSRATPS